MAVTRARLTAPPQALQPRDALRRARLPSVSGLDYDVSGGDFGTAVDSRTVTLTSGAVLKADTATAADVATVTAAHTYNQAANDTGTAADARTVTLHPTTISLTFADTAHPVDARGTPIPSRFLSVAKADSATTADVFRIRNRLSFSDAATVVDGLQGASAPSVILVQPQAGSTNVSPDTPVLLRFTQGLGSTITNASIVVLVNSQAVWLSNAPALGWTGTFTSPAPGQLQLALYPPRGFAYQAHVALQVTFNYTAS